MISFFFHTAAQDHGHGYSGGHSGGYSGGHSGGYSGGHGAEQYKIIKGIYKLNLLFQFHSVFKQINLFSKLIFN